MNLKIDVQDKGNKQLVKLSGEVDVHTITNLKETLIPLTETENSELIVNLEKVAYIDSSGLGVFIAVYKSAEENNNKFSLTHLQDRVYRLFNITSLDTLIDIQQK